MPSRLSLCTLCPVSSLTRHLENFEGASVSFLLAHEETVDSVTIESFYISMSHSWRTEGKRTLELHSTMAVMESQRCIIGDIEEYSQY